MSRRRSKGPRAPRTPDGRVITRHGPVLTVQRPDGSRIDCLARGKGKLAVVGDQVAIDPDADTEMAAGMVVEVAPRRTELARADSFGKRQKVIAANVDQLLVVCATEPPLRPGLIDRLLVAAHAQGIAGGVVLNKADLLTDPEERAWVDEDLAPYRAIGYPVIEVSATEGTGLDDLRAALAGKVSVFVGHSGVGKTSLLNALHPGLGERVLALSEHSGKGQHTTTTASLFALPEGGELIDSPGIRTFSLWNIDPDTVGQHFLEFAAHAEACRFHNCRHDQEPGCAVKDALDAGEISEARYDSYLRIRHTLDGGELRGVRYGHTPRST